ncbi:hypothetical protein PG988_010094 [Apiospora saccharicola]
MMRLQLTGRRGKGNKSKGHPKSWTQSRKYGLASMELLINTTLIHAANSSEGQNKYVNPQCIVEALVEVPKPIKADN